MMSVIDADAHKIESESTWDCMLNTYRGHGGVSMGRAATAFGDRLCFRI